MKTEDEIYCKSFMKISNILACTSNEEVISREDSYKIKKLLEKCYLEVIHKINKGGIKDPEKARLAKYMFERTYQTLSLNTYDLDPNEDYYYPLYMILKEWDDNCKYYGIKYYDNFCEGFLDDYYWLQPVHI